MDEECIIDIIYDVYHMMPPLPIHVPGQCTIWRQPVMDEAWWSALGA